MNIGFVSLGMGRDSLTRVLEVAGAVGSEALELNGRPGVHGDLWNAPVNFAALKARLAAGSVRVTSLGGYSNFAQLTDEALNEQVEQLVGYCEVARALGIPVVRAFSGDVMEGHTLEEFYPRIVAGFKAVTARVADWGLKLGIENHGRLMNHGDWLARLVDEVGSPILGFTLDTGNFCWAGHSLDVAHRFLEQLAPRAVNVHVKDGVFARGEWVLRPAGRGDIDLPWLFRTLAGLGYSGPVLSEYEGPDEFVASTLESVAYLKGLRDAIIGDKEQAR